MASQPTVSAYRKELCLNLQVLHKVQPLPKVAQAIFQENGLGKLTQVFFNNISYYLLFLIDPHLHSKLTWPLCDTKAERAFRSEFSSFISDYASKGLLTDVRPSYLVHPSSYKVTILIFQLSVLAVKQLLNPRIKGTEKQKMLTEITGKFSNKTYIKQNSDYMKNINRDYEKKTLNKLVSFMHKKQCWERIAGMLHTKIAECEAKLLSINTQGYIDKLVNNFLETSVSDEQFKSEILKIKNVNEPASILDECLKELDSELGIMERKWDAKVLPLLEKCRHMQSMSEELVKRQTGQIDRSCYMLVYDPMKDALCIDALKNEVNSCQLAVLKTIEQNGRLNFLKLIQAFVISMGYILRNNKFGDEIYNFNENVEIHVKEAGEVIEAFRTLLERINIAEKKLQPQPGVDMQSIPIEDSLQIPPIPDISGLKMCQVQYHIGTDTFTPLNMSKHQFNLRMKGEVFTRPQHRSIITSHYAPKDDFLKTILSCRVSTYDRGNISNISMISNIKGNETIAECSSGFTKQQIARLLSTKKKSSTKKNKVHESHNNLKIYRGDLFSDSVQKNDSPSLIRSHSSPNLFLNRDKRHVSNIRGRKLSIMQEDSPPLGVSGIACFDTKFNTPTRFSDAESSTAYQKISNEVKDRLLNVQREIENVISPILDPEKTSSKIVELQEPLKSKTITVKELPLISISPIVDEEDQALRSKTNLKSKTLARNSQATRIPKIVTAKKIPTICVTVANQPEVLSETKDSQGSYMSNTVISKTSLSPLQDLNSKSITPKPNTGLIKKTGSLEKIINRFKQVRANVIPLKEENENVNMNDGLANRNLLPDLLSPSCGLLNERPNNCINIDSDEDLIADPVRRQPRLSLGTMLGVDHNFLDQFDLVD